MVRRRVAALDHRLDSTVLALGDGRRRPHAVRASLADSPEGRRLLTAADLVVTTSGSCLAYAVARGGRLARLVHTAHVPAHALLGCAQFREHSQRLALLVVPSTYDVRTLAVESGIDPGRIRVHDDFTLPGTTLAATGAGRSAVAVGHVRPGSGILTVVDGFALALPELPGWQLRLLADGPLGDVLADRITRLRLGNRVAWSRGGAELASVHAGAGLAVRITDEEAYGLPVLDALTAGLPVLGGTGVPAVRERVRHEQNGLVLHEPTAEAVAGALIRFGDSAFRAECAHNAARLPGGRLDRAGQDQLERIIDLALDTAPR